MKIHLLILSALCLTACANFTSINGLPAAIFNPVEHARVVSQIDQNKDKYITAAEIKASFVVRISKPLKDVPQRGAD